MVSFDGTRQDRRHIQVCYDAVKRYLARFATFERHNLLHKSEKGFPSFEQVKTTLKPSQLPNILLGGSSVNPLIFAGLNFDSLMMDHKTYGLA